MNILNKKNTLIISAGYILFSVLFSFATLHWFSLIYFGAIALLVILADKILPENKSELTNPLIVAVAAAICNSTLHNIFYYEHSNLDKLLCAFAIAILFAGIFAATNEKNLPYAILGAPLLCFLNLGIALCYSVLLACISVINICSGAKSKPQKKKSKKEKNNNVDFNLIAVIVCVLCTAVCIYLYTKPKNQHNDSFVYYLNTFKNNPAVIISSIYLLIKLLKSKFKAKLPMIMCVIALTLTAASGAFHTGIAVLSLACLCMLALLLHCCMLDDETLEKIKTDYNANKFIFWTLLLCLLL